MEPKKECPIYDVDDIEMRPKYIDIEPDENTTVSIHDNGMIYVRGKARISAYYMMIQQSLNLDPYDEAIVNIEPDTETAGDGDE